MEGLVLALQGSTAAKAGKDVDRKLCYGLDDLRIGTFVQVHGRAFFIHDSDEFTKQWYKVCLPNVEKCGLIVSHGSR